MRSADGLRAVGYADLIFESSRISSELRDTEPFFVEKVLAPICG